MLFKNQFQPFYVWIGMVYSKQDFGRLVGHWTIMREDISTSKSMCNWKFQNKTWKSSPAQRKPYYNLKYIRIENTTEASQCRQISAATTLRQT